MPSVVGYPVKRTSTKKWELERARVEGLWEWSREVRKAHREGMWERNERQYMGRHWSSFDGAIDSNQDEITVNMSFSTVNTIVPYITGSEPSFYVEPYMAPANKRAAVALKTWLNRTWRHHEVNGQEHLELAAQDHLIYGDGYIEVLWAIEEVLAPSQFPGEQGTPTERAEITVERTSPWDVWIDPWADGATNARFVAIRKSIPVSVVIKSDRYQNVKDLAGNSNYVEDDTSKLPEGRVGNMSTGDARDELVDVIEFYDLVAGNLICFIPGRTFPVRVVEGARLPLFHLKSYRIPRLPYGMSEMEQLWSLQLELNKTRSQMITHRKRNVAKYLARATALDQDGIDALQGEDVNAIVWIKSNDPLDSVVRPLEMAQMTADPYQVSDIITRDIYEISGVNEYLRGASPNMTRTATEATIIESASNVKSAFKLRQIEKFVRKIGQHMLDVASEVFPTTPMDEFTMVLIGREAQALAAQNDDPNPGAVMEAQMELTEDTFLGEYQVFVESNSTEMRNPRFRAEQLKDTMLTLAQVVPLIVQTGGVPPNMSKVLELWLEAVGIDDLDAILAPQAPPAMPGLPPGVGGDNLEGSQPGMPNLGTVGAPTAPLTSANTGAL